MPTRAQRGFASRSTLTVIAAAFAAGLGLWLAQRHFAPAPVAPPPTLQAVHLVEPGRPLPAWRLRLSDGTEATPATLAGHWTVVFLGFTHCPDVCPTTLGELAPAQKAWSALPAATRPRLLFVSVDPERDTPGRVGEYAHFFHPDTLAATGTPAELARFAESLGLVFMKIPGAGGDYSMDHSSRLVLLDPQGRFAGVVQPNPPPQRALDSAQIAADLLALAQARP